MARILIVDDDDEILRVACVILKAATHTVVTAQNGHAALDILNKETFDLIISDVNMPGGVSGFNLVTTIRKNDKFKNVPIMFLTARRDKNDVKAAMTAGADDFSVKPIDRALFLAKIESLLHKRGPDSFSATPLKMTGTWEVKFDIIGLSEQGLILMSSIAMPLNEKFTLEAELFKLLGFNAPQLRVSTCQQLQSPHPAYEINADFIGLTEAEFKKIRQWVMANQPVIAKVS